MFKNRVIPYRCLSTGFNAGMIEVVRDSKTVMKIQRESLTGGIQLNTRTLHKWIKENNRDRCVRLTSYFSCLALTSGYNFMQL